MESPPTRPPSPREIAAAIIFAIVAALLIYALGGCSTMEDVGHSMTPDEIQFGVSSGWGSNDGLRAGSADTERNTAWVAPTWYIGRKSQTFDHELRQANLRANELLERLVAVAGEDAPASERDSVAPDDHIPWWEKEAATKSIIAAAVAALAGLGYFQARKKG